MSHSNISIFIPNLGCPGLCAFCNQRSISGAQTQPSPEEIGKICAEALKASKNPAETEIAFFGGSFTALERGYMLSLLSAAHDYIGEGRFAGIRISTRPDAVDEDILTTLMAYGVTSIELGAQSMSDRVLAANLRGHSVDDVKNAAMLVKSFGFELGLQVMVGLYKSSPQTEVETMNAIISQKPDTVRIYPVVVLENTELGRLYKEGKYKPFTFEMCVNLCALMLTEYKKSGIRVIKCGLHASELVEAEAIAGFYHPAFREICESRIFRMKIEALVLQDSSAVVAVNPKCVSKAVGQGRENIEFFAKKGVGLRIVGDESVAADECKRIIDRCI